MKYLENFNSFNNNIINILDYVLLLRKILKRIKKGYIEKEHIIHLLNIINELKLGNLPDNIFRIFKEHQKDFSRLVKVVDNFKVYKQDYNKKIQDLNTLKEFLKKEIENI